MFPINLGYVAQSARALDCGSKGCGFEPRHTPKAYTKMYKLFYLIIYVIMSL